MTQATITSKGQITLPVTIRRQLGLHTGDRVEFILQGESYQMLPMTRSIHSLKGVVSQPKQPVTLEAMEKAISEGASGQ